MINITKLEQTCTACPTQFHGKTDKDEDVYIRFRFGRLSMEIGHYMVFSETISDGLAGVIDIETIKEKLKSLDISWPENVPFNENYYEQ